LLAWWRENYELLLEADPRERFEAIVHFHYEFLRIHPFLDGNGRVARLIMEQQARELLGVDRRLILDDSSAYNAALMQAHDGNLGELRRILSQALFGTWAPEP
jgi:Fic family protein